MKKKINYQSKYFSNKQDKKSPQIYIILGFLAFIFIVIVVVLYGLFNNNDEKIKELKYDEVSVKNEIQLYLKLNEYEKLNSKIDDYLSREFNKKFKEELIYLKLNILMTMNDIELIRDTIQRYSKLMTKEDIYFLNGYINYLTKDYKNAKKNLSKIKNNKNIYRDSALLLAKIYFDENEIDSAINILKTIQDKDAIILYNLAYLSMLKEDLISAENYMASINKVDSFDILFYRIELLNLQISLKDKKYMLANESLKNVYDYPFLKQTYLYNSLITNYYLDSNSNSNFTKEKDQNLQNILMQINDNKEDYSYLLYQLMFVVLFFENNENQAIEFFEENKEKILQFNFERFLILALILYDRQKQFNKIIDICDFNLINSFDEEYFTAIFTLFFNATLKTKKFDLFYDYCQRLIKQRKEKELILNYMIEGFISQGKTEEGLNFILNIDIFESYPPYYYILLAKLNIAKGDYQTALKNISTVEKMNLDNYDKDEIYSFICKFYLKIKKLDDFKKLFSLISEENRKKPENLNLLLNYYIYLKDYDGILETSNNLLKDNPLDKRLLFYTALAYYEKKEYSNAAIFFSKLIEKEKDLKKKAIFAIYLGNCYAYNNDRSLAMFYYKQASVWDDEQTYSIVNSQILEKVNY